MVSCLNNVETAYFFITVFSIKRVMKIEKQERKSNYVFTVWMAQPVIGYHYSLFWAISDLQPDPERLR